MYSNKVRQLVAELPNHGQLDHPTHAARRDNPVCGDVLRLTLRVEGGVVREVGYEAQGCPAALACAAALSLFCPGQQVERCLQFQAADLVQFLEGLSSHKLHGADLALETLRAALLQPPD